MSQTKKATSIKELTFEDMKSGIRKAGGLFYQYRSCRCDAATIYDIDNIRHGVVYAQTPLKMNDPFDSMIGYSAEKIYGNCVDLVIEELKIDNENEKLIISYLLKYKKFGKLIELITILKKLKSYLHARQKEMHMVNIPLNKFITDNSSTLYFKCTREMKDVLNKNAFVAFALIISKMGDIEITKESLSNMVNLNLKLDELYEIISNAQDLIHKEFINIISILTVSCFSISGWNNQLMWSHYASSYSGICIEYDFEKINNFIGFIYPVNYTSERPTVSLRDLGIKNFVDIKEKNSTSYSPDILTIVSYLLAKNDCWNYEKEWRIINIGEPFTSKLINLPFIKSITLGSKMDHSYKQLIFDICKEKNIECYELVVSNEEFSLTRENINDDNFKYDSISELNYIGILSKQVSELSRKIFDNINNLNEACENGNIVCSYILMIIEEAVDYLCNAYFLKTSFNRYCDHIEEDASNDEIPSEITNVVNLINTEVLDFEKSKGEFKNSLSTFYSCGKINYFEYIAAEKNLNDMEKLCEKIKSFDWHPLISPTSLVDNDP